MSSQKIKAYVDLNHVLSSGMVTYPGTSDLEITEFCPRYPNGALIDSVKFLSITSTYIDAPFHVDPNGKKISEYPLERLVNLPVVLVTKPDHRRMFTIEDIEILDVDGKAVLFHTSFDNFFGKPGYDQNPPYISVEVAEWLVEKKAVLVGIDSILVDDVNDGSTIPVHTTLLRNGIAIAENMTNLSALVDQDAYLTAVPPRAETGSFPTRIFATLLEQ
ncbi:cyclase family protein [Pseudomonas eucalypticola]|uniref:Cyclase family protein n=1 Tax=Pseudomonas eucalypticola TaxID=2599595 RepID=A0A7D5H5E3_9PSED|nr:cyclase family protein [Pseudomonas eucalypticola]QKZ04243.1 cyclase family protein [Pseudomonas eucalypticola]